MQTTSHTAASPPAAAVRRIGAAVATTVDLLHTWAEVARQRRQLAGLSDHMLRDIGVSRADVEFEIRRPVWDRDGDGRSRL